MALPDLAALRAFLREPPVAANPQLTEALADAKAMVGGFLGRPIDATARTFTRLRSVWDETEETEVLMLPEAPIAGSPVVTDDDGATVVGGNYDVDRARGWLYAKSGISYSWANGPYGVTTTVGLANHPDYATRIEPVLRAAILEVAGDLYTRKNSAVQQEGAAGSYAGYASLAELPARVEGMLKPWRRAPRV
jgi:hypothetical protein